MAKKATAKKEEPEQETALATKEETALTTQEPIEGLPDIDQSDLIVPRYQIVQPSSDKLKEAGGQEGQFHSNLDGRSIEKARVTPLTTTKGRVYFEEGDDKPTCKSDDGWKPSPKIEAPINHVCAVRDDRGQMKAVCPAAQWGPNGESPKCALVYNLLALNNDDMDMPFFIGLKGTSVKPAKRLISFFALRRLSLFSHSCEMGTTKTKNSRGTFYVANFGGFAPHEPRDRYRDQFLQLRGYDLERTYEAEEASSEAADGGEGGGGEGGGGNGGMF